MAAFKFTGKLDPKAFVIKEKKVGESKMIPYLTDTEIAAKMKNNVGKGNKGDLRDLLIACVNKYADDLDSVLFGMMDSAQRMKSVSSVKSMVRMDLDTAQKLTDAVKFLKEKGYKGVSIPRIVGACLLQHAYNKKWIAQPK